MKPSIKIVNNRLLKQHEKIRTGHLNKLQKKIAADGCITDPIIVDKNTMVILDGHHRFNAIKRLGLTHSPVFLCQLQK